MDKRPEKIKDMFAKISGRYDLMNRLMTAGQDRKWRREVIERAEITPGNLVLDLGTGTGDLARESFTQTTGIKVVGVDITLEMMRAGARKNNSSPIYWTCAEALHLPYPNGYFDVVVSGFLLRNVSDVDQCLGEQYRILRTGGRIVALDTTSSEENLYYPLVQLHMRKVIPTMGRLLTSDSNAYRYLPDSTSNFLDADTLQEKFKKAGFSDSGFRKMMFGTIAIHWGLK